MSPAGAPALRPVYVWQWPVRLAHWAIVASIVALTITGLYVAHPFVSAPGEASTRFVMGWMRTIHFLASMVFGLAVILRVAWMFLGSPWAQWREIVPTTRARLRELWAVVKFYAFPRGAYPYHRPGHNPLAGLSYLFFYGLSLAIMATGVALYSLEAGVGSHMRGFGFLVPLLGGAARARFLHHVLMWPALIFAMIHIYIVVFVARVEGGGIIDAMVTGRKVTSAPPEPGEAGAPGRQGRA